MRTSKYYGIDVPELGDRADITVVSDAIMANEDSQSGKVENMKATLNSTIIELTSECRTNKLLKYYNGLSIQFVSPVDINAGNSYNIKIDNLAEQPYNNKTDIKAGDIVQAYYGASGFVSSNTPIPRSSSTSSSSEVTVATSLAVKNANDNANTRALKTTQIIAGKGLTGGGNLTSDKTFNVVSANDGIIVNEDNIQLNPVDDLSNSSTTRALAANQGLILDNKDKGIVGGYNGKFPLTSATKGNIYLLENTQKYYICINNYDGIQISVPNANFEELSVYTNRSKLDNLSEYKYQLIGTYYNGNLINFAGYRSFYGELFLTASNSGITDAKFTLQGIVTIDGYLIMTYNDNNYPLGSVGVSISGNKLIFGGGYFNTNRLKYSKLNLYGIKK